MTGRNHERVPGQDAPPLIGVEESAKGFALVVRRWNGSTAFCRPYRTHGAAVAAEASLRSALVHAHGGDVPSALASWWSSTEPWIDEWWS